MDEAVKAARATLSLALRFALALASASCIGAGALPGASAQPVPATALPEPSPAAPCAGRAKQPRNSTWSVTVWSDQRAFVVHVPPSYDPTKPTPLVLNFHGYSMNPRLEDWLTSMSAKADAAGFILVYPEGTGSPLSFDGGNCCGDSRHDHVDDVGFTRAMLDALEANLCVDPARVYATGMSNGGFMSHRLACDLSDRIAAIASVAGVNATTDCHPLRPVPVLDLHGTANPVVPYTGNPRDGWRSVDDTIAGWVARDGCTGSTTALATSDVTCVSHAPCAAGAEVELCTIQGGGHTWPGGKDVPHFLGIGKTTHAINADDLIWSFFERHPMPPRGGVVMSN